MRDRPGKRDRLGQMCTTREFCRDREFSISIDLGPGIWGITLIHKVIFNLNIQETNIQDLNTSTKGHWHRGVCL